VAAVRGAEVELQLEDRRGPHEVRFVGPKHGPLAWVGGPWDSTVWAGRPIVGQYTVGEAVYSTKVIKAPKYEVGP
jgi:hypothetical protein